MYRHDWDPSESMYYTGERNKEEEMSELEAFEAWKEYHEAERFSFYKTKDFLIHAILVLVLSIAKNAYSFYRTLSTETDMLIKCGKACVYSVLITPLSIIVYCFVAAAIYGIIFETDLNSAIRLDNDLDRSARWMRRRKGEYADGWRRCATSALWEMKHKRYLFGKFVLWMSIPAADILLRIVGIAW